MPQQQWISVPRWQIHMTFHFLVPRSPFLIKHRIVPISQWHWLRALFHTNSSREQATALFVFVLWYFGLNESFNFSKKLFVAHQFICVVKVHNNAKRLHRTTTYHNHNKNCSSTLVVRPHTFCRSVSVCHCNIIRNLLVVCWFFGVRVCSRFVIVGAALELFMPKKATLVPPKTKMKLLLYCNDVTEFSFFLCCYSSVCMFFSDYNCKIIVSFENRKFKICETKERF